MGKDRRHAGEYPFYSEGPEGTHPHAGVLGIDHSLDAKREESTSSAEAIHAKNLVYAALRRWWKLPPRTPKERDDFKFLQDKAKFPPLVANGGTSVLEGEFVTVDDIEGNGSGCLKYNDRVIEDTSKPRRSKV